MLPRVKSRLTYLLDILNCHQKINTLISLFVLQAAKNEAPADIPTGYTQLWPKDIRRDDFGIKNQGDTAITDAQQSGENLKISSEKTHVIDDHFRGDIEPEDSGVHHTTEASANASYFVTEPENDLPRDDMPTEAKVLEQNTPHVDVKVTEQSAGFPASASSAPVLANVQMDIEQVMFIVPI